MVERGMTWVNSTIFPNPSKILSILVQKSRITAHRSNHSHHSSKPFRMELSTVRFYRELDAEAFGRCGYPVVQVGQWESS